MPEGPQMIFLKEQAEQFVGQLVMNVTGEAKNIPFEFLKNKEVLEIKTYGKEVFFCFQEGALRVHLMLFGSYTINSHLNRKLTLGLEFEFGEINFYACASKLIMAPLNTVYDWSLDVMSERFDPVQALEKLTRTPNRRICDALLDQNIFAGVGNGIKNEVLFKRRIHPLSHIGEIPPSELKHLIQDCVEQSFAYLNSLQEGTMEEHWQVYRRKTCLRDFIPLQREKLGKPARSCYFCEKCQILYMAETL